MFGECMSLNRACVGEERQKMLGVGQGLGSKVGTPKADSSGVVERLPPTLKETGPKSAHPAPRLL